MDSATQVQTLDKAVCISHSANTLRKSINPTILLLPVMSKIVGQSVLFNFGMATSLREGKVWIQTSCKPEDWWALPDYFCPSHAT